MKYAYIRVSKKDQNLNRQIDNLLNFYKNKLDKNNIFYDKKTGKHFDRKYYILLKSTVKKGDEIIIHELDRLGRNKKEIKRELEWFYNHGVIPRILNIPTTLYSFSAEQGWLDDMINNIFIEVYSTLAEQERETISRRTKEGLASARTRGNYGGRPKIEKKLINKALKLYKNKNTINDIVNTCNISKGTFYKYLKSHILELSLHHDVQTISKLTGTTVNQINKYL